MGAPFYGFSGVMDNTREIYSRDVGSSPTEATLYPWCKGHAHEATDFKDWVQFLVGTPFLIYIRSAGIIGNTTWRMIRDEDVGSNPILAFFSQCY